MEFAATINTIGVFSTYSRKGQKFYLKRSFLRSYERLILMKTLGYIDEVSKKRLATMVDKLIPQKGHLKVFNQIWAFSITSFVAANDLRGFGAFSTKRGTTISIRTDATKTLFDVFVVLG